MCLFVVVDDLLLRDDLILRERFGQLDGRETKFLTLRRFTRQSLPYCLIVQDETRRSLTAIVDSVDTKYFYYIISALRKALTRGYQMHILGFTLHALLCTLTKRIKHGEIDYCLPELTEVCMRLLVHGFCSI